MRVSIWTEGLSCDVLRVLCIGLVYAMGCVH